MTPSKHGKPVNVAKLIQPQIVRQEYHPAPSSRSIHDLIAGRSVDYFRAATFSQERRRIGRRAVAVIAERSKTVLPLRPHAPAAGRKMAGSARRIAACCSGVS